MQNYKRFANRALVMVLAAVMTVASVFSMGGQTASAATALKVTPASKTITVGKTVTLKANKKVKWTIKSGTKIVKITKKYNKSAVVKGLKPGTAYIKAKAGTKSKTVKVVVKAPKGSVKTGDVKSGLFTTKIDLSSGTYAQEGQIARVWVPIPESDAYQTITGFGFEAPKATTAKVIRDSAGNKVLFLEFGADVAAADRTAKIHYHVARKAIASTDMVEYGSVPASIKADYVDATFETMGDAADQAEIKKIAESIVAEAGAKTIKAKAKAIFDWEINNLYRREGNKGETVDGFSFGGCGRGEVIQVLTKTFGGKCTDLNSTYVALCRSVGVPAREKFGCRLNGNANGGQHCRAEFYLPGTGWVEADPADALKTLRNDYGLIYGVAKITDMDPAVVEEVKTHYWGSNDNNWVKLAAGRDIYFENPAQQAQCPEQKVWERCVLNPSGTLNNMGYVYGEMIDPETNVATYMNTYNEADTSKGDAFGYVMKFMKDAN